MKHIVIFVIFLLFHAIDARLLIKCIFNCRKERDQLRASGTSTPCESEPKCSSCCCGGMQVIDMCGGGNTATVFAGCPIVWRSSVWEGIQSALLLLALVGLSLLTWLSLHLQSRLDATQNFLSSGKFE